MSSEAQTVAHATASNLYESLSNEQQAMFESFLLAQTEKPSDNPPPVLGKKRAIENDDDDDDDESEPEEARQHDHSADEREIWGGIEEDPLSDNEEKDENDPWEMSSSTMQALKIRPGTVFTKHWTNAQRTKLKAMKIPSKSATAFKAPKINPSLEGQLKSYVKAKDATLRDCQAANINVLKFVDQLYSASLKSEDKTMQPLAKAAMEATLATLGAITLKRRAALVQSLGLTNDIFIDEDKQVAGTAAYIFPDSITITLANAIKASEKLTKAINSSSKKKTGNDSYGKFNQRNQFNSHPSRSYGRRDFNSYNRDKRQDHSARYDQQRSSSYKHHGKY